VLQKGQMMPEKNRFPAVLVPETAHSLRADGFDASEDGTGRGTPIVPVAYRTNSAGQIDCQGDQSAALTTMTDQCTQFIAFTETGQGWWSDADSAATVRKGNEAGGGGARESTLIAFAQNSRDEVRIFGEDGQTVGALVAEPGAKQQTYIAFSSKDHGADALEDVAHPLRAMGHSESHANAGGQLAVMTLAVRGREGQPQLEVRDDGIANAVLTPNGGRAGIGVGAVAIGWSEELTPSVDLASPIQYGGQGGRHDGVMTPAMAVRRLTPRECERLQGFPDDYTKISAKTADGPRYKALGNSMAVPVIRWIGERIQRVEELAESGN
jgi:DNA (cytosine-5)-methyltransferase 1